MAFPDIIRDSQNIERAGQPVMIAREATHEEWVADVKANGGEPDAYGEFPYYYEVAD